MRILYSCFCDFYSFWGNQNGDLFPNAVGGHLANDYSAYELSPRKTVISQYVYIPYLKY